MDPRTGSRRKRLAALIVVLPLLAGVVIAGLAHFLGSENAGTADPATHPEPQRRAAATSVTTGSPAPRIRLREAGGASFDSASLAGAPYAVLFVSTRCDAIGRFLARGAAEIREDGDGAAIVAIAADPAVDRPAAARAWLARHRIDTGRTLHYLLGTERQVSGPWNAWGFAGPSDDCLESYPVHLITGAGADAGVIDVDPDSSPALLSGALGGEAR